MDNKVFSVSGFVLVLLGLIATVCIFAFQTGIRELGWIDLEAAALGTMVVCLTGTILGWISFRNSTGVAAGILGSLLLAFYVFQLFRAGGASQPAPEYPATIQDPAPIVQSTSRKTPAVSKTPKDVSSFTKKDATQALFLAIQRNPNLFPFCAGIASPDQIKIAFVEADGFSPGSISVNLSKQSYSFVITFGGGKAGDEFERVFYEGKFVVVDGGWLATPPDDTRTEWGSITH